MAKGACEGSVSHGAYARNCDTLPARLRPLVQEMTMAATKKAAKKATKKAAKKATKGKGKVEKVMHEYKEGSLKSGGKKKVTSRKQAVAIALSEAREAGAKIPKKKKT